MSKLPKFTYQELIDLGFKRTPFDQQWWKKFYGVEGYYLSYKFKKNTELVFHIMDDHVRYEENDKQGNITKKSFLYDINEVQFLIECLEGRLKEKKENIPYSTWA